LRKGPADVVGLAPLPRDGSLGRRPSTSDTIGDIQRAAREEFTARGFDGTTIDGIARKAKVSKQLIYYYFGSKADLYSLILEEAALETKLFGNQVDILAPDEALKHFIEQIFLEFLRRPQIIQMTIDEAQHGFTHVGSRSSLKLLLKNMIASLEEIILEGQRQHIFRSDIEVDGLFWIIFSIVTTWFSCAPMIALVSSAKMGSENGLLFWRSYTSQFVLDAILEQT
jgi:AcrR family transcriptional regulator